MNKGEYFFSSPSNVMTHNIYSLFYLISGAHICSTEICHLASMMSAMDDDRQYRDICRIYARYP